MIDKIRITNSVTREADALEVCQMQREISRLQVLMTTWTHNIKSFVLYVDFNRAPTSDLEVFLC